MNAPKRLEGEAKAAWKKLAEDFNPQTAADVELMAQWCECAAQYAKAYAEGQKGSVILSLNNGTSCVNHALQHANAQTKLMARLYTMLQPLRQKKGKKPFEDI